LKKSRGETAFDFACNYLSYRQRSTAEVRRHLRTRGYGDIEKDILGRLTAADLLDDRIFAVTWISERALFKSYGPVRLSSELRRMGVPEQIIKDAIQSAYPIDTEHENMLRAGATKWRQLGDIEPPKKKAKVAEFLARRGFSIDKARRAAEELATGED